MYNRDKSRWMKHLDFILLDLLSLFLAFLAAYAIREPSTGWALSTKAYRQLFVSLVCMDLATMTFSQAFKDVLKRGYMIELGYTIRNAAILYGLEMLLLFGLQAGVVYSRLFFLWLILLYVFFSFGIRAAYKKYYREKVVPQDGRSLLVVTTRDRLPELDSQVADGYFAAFRLAGLALLDAELGEGEISRPDRALPVVADKNSLEDYVRRNWVDEVLLILPLDKETERLAGVFMEMGIVVHVGLNAFKESLPSGKQELTQLGGYDVITVFWNSANFLEYGLKRAMDLVGGLIGCLITALLTLFIGPAIYLSSPGPIFFKQQRVGRNGKVFEMYKFRSMVMNADQLKEKYMQQNRVGSGMMFKLDWDPRIIGNKELPDGSRKTGIGEFIRKTSLDEFPQFFNVLKGDMSLVGTRPPTLDEWNRYEDHHRARMAMRPGITGLWQVSGRSSITDFEEVVRLDTKYIAGWSLLLDVKILLKTVLVVLRREGSM